MPIPPVVEVLPSPVFRTWNGGTQPVVMLRFDRDQFDPALFARHGIVRPAAIAASVMQRQAEYFHGRLAARMALAPLGLANHDVGTGAFREPVWPAGVFGSISHNGQLAVAAAAGQDGNGGIGIGIDIESIQPVAGRATLEDQVMSGRELAYLHSLDSPWPLATLMTLVFSAKESFFKASFRTVGRYFDFDALEVQRLDIAAKLITFRIVAELTPELPARALRVVRFTLVDATTVFTACDLPSR